MKYDFDLDIETRNSLSLIISRIQQNSTVLEFGPANGRMTKYLKQVLNCKVYAVEIDKDAAKDAEVYCEEILVDNVETYTWVEKYRTQQFDYIVFADVLEHLYYPEKALKESISLLKENGSILISVPNIAHNAIIMELLNDQFTYRDVGLLDNTHIRFFTKNTLEQLIYNCGLSIQYETGSYVPPINTEFQYSYTDCDANVSNKLIHRKFGEVYQFVIEAKKNAHKPVIDFEKESYATLYYDTGSGFNENDKVITKFTLENNSIIKFNLSNINPPISAIRIDPLKEAIELKINFIKVNNIDKSNFIFHNGIDKDKKHILFLHNNPYIIIPLDKSQTIDEVSLKYEYFSTIPNVAYRIIQQELEEKDQQLEEKDQQILHWYNLAQSMRIKNRIKKLLGLKSND